MFTTSIAAPASTASNASACLEAGFPPDYVVVVDQQQPIAGKAGIRRRRNRPICPYPC
jgi:hypothetical protein